MVFTFNTENQTIKKMKKIRDYPKFLSNYILLQLTCKKWLNNSIWGIFIPNTVNGIVNSAIIRHVGKIVNVGRKRNTK